MDCHCFFIKALANDWVLHLGVFVTNLIQCCRQSGAGTTINSQALDIYGRNFLF